LGVGLGGAGGAPCFGPCGGAELGGAGVAGGLISSSSTSKIRVALAPMSGLTARSPYARFAGTKN
jgi:hypothetical protein